MSRKTQRSRLTTEITTGNFTKKDFTRNNRWISLNNIKNLLNNQTFIKYTAKNVEVENLKRRIVKVKTILKIEVLKKKGLFITIFKATGESNNLWTVKKSETIAIADIKSYLKKSYKLTSPITIIYSVKVGKSPITKDLKKTIAI